MEIKQLWLSEKDFAQLYKKNDIIPEKYTVDGNYALSTTGTQINSRYQIGSNKFLFLKDDVTGELFCFVQTQQGAKAYFVSNTELNKNSVFSVYSGSGKAKVAMPVAKEDKPFAKQLQEMASVLDYKSTYKELNPRKFNPHDDKEVNGLIEEGIRVINEKEKVEQERDKLKEQRDGFFDRIQELKWDLKNKNVQLHLAQKEINKLVDEGMQYLTQRDAFERKYNSELERRKTLQQENQLLTEELSGLAADVLALSVTNVIQSEKIEKSLQDIRNLVDALNKSTIRNIELDKKVSGLVEDVIGQSAEIAGLKTKNQILQDENQELKLEVEGILNDCMALEADKKTVDEELREARARITASMPISGGSRIIRSGVIMSGNVYRLTSANKDEKPIYLAVGQHYSPTMRATDPSVRGKDCETLYVILNGNPALQKDAADNPMTVEQVLLDPDKRNELNIHGVKEITYDKNGNARIRHYDHKVKLRRRGGVTTSDIIVSDNHFVKVKDVVLTGPDSLIEWVDREYYAGKVRELKPTIKTRTALKCAGIIAAVTFVLGAGAFGGFKAWGGPNEADLARESGRTQMTQFVGDLEESENLFQYTEAKDNNGNPIKYIKNVNGVETAVYGNKVSAIGNASRVFYKDATNKVEISAHKQENFWGKLKDYKEATVLGAAYELGAQAVAELNENNVPVYSLDENGNKKPIYVYLNSAANHDYSSQSSMISYLTNNGYSQEMAEKITAEYESGFASGLENGLSNKVEQIIGGQGIVETPPAPVVDYNATATKEAIATVIAANTPHGRKYTADGLEVCYSDISAKTGAEDEQVVFVIAKQESKATAEDEANKNKYLYKIVLNTGANDAIAVDDLNAEIADAESVTESIRLDYMFRNLKCDNVISNFYKNLEGNNIAYVSNYGIEQNEDGFEVTPSVTVYNADQRTIIENNANNTVSVDVGKDSSITEMCALAILGDYGYYDKKGIYEVTPAASEDVYVKKYTTGEKEL